MCAFVSLSLKCIRIYTYVHSHMYTRHSRSSLVPALIPLPLQYAPATMLLQPTCVPKHVRPPPHFFRRILADQVTISTIPDHRPGRRAGLSPPRSCARSSCGNFSFDRFALFGEKEGRCLRLVTYRDCGTRMPPPGRAGGPGRRLWGCPGGPRTRCRQIPSRRRSGRTGRRRKAL